MKTILFLLLDTKNKTTGFKASIKSILGSWLYDLYIINEYIKWYAEKRIKLLLGGMGPLDYRRSLDFAD